MDPAERDANLAPLRAILDPPHGLFALHATLPAPPPVTPPLLPPQQVQLAQHAQQEAHVPGAATIRSEAVPGPESRTDAPEVTAGTESDPIEATHSQAADATPPDSSATTGRSADTEDGSSAAVGTTVSPIGGGPVQAEVEALLGPVNGEESRFVTGDQLLSAASVEGVGTEHETSAAPNSSCEPSSSPQAPQEGSVTASDHRHTADDAQLPAAAANEELSSTPLEETEHSDGGATPRSPAVGANEQEEWDEHTSRGVTHDDQSWSEVDLESPGVIIAIKPDKDSGAEKLPRGVSGDTGGDGGIGVVLDASDHADAGEESLVSAVHASDQDYVVQPVAGKRPASDT